MLKKYFAFLLAIIVLVNLFPLSFAVDPSAQQVSIFKIEGGGVKMTKGTAKEFNARAGLRLYDGYTVKTPDKSNAWLKLDEASLLKMDGKTEVGVSKASRNKLTVSVKNGSAAVDANLKSGNEIDVQVGNTTLAVRGTFFVVEYLGGKHVIYTMLKGSGIINGKHHLGAGQSMTAHDEGTMPDQDFTIRNTELEHYSSFVLQTILENSDKLGDIFTPEDFAKIKELLDSMPQSQTTDPPVIVNEIIYTNTTESAGSGGGNTGGSSSGGSSGSVGGGTPNTPYAATISPSGTYTFPAQVEGYLEQAEQIFTVTNTGTQPLTGITAALTLGAGSAFVEDDDPGFVLPKDVSIPAGESIMFSILHKDALPIGTYTDTLVVTGDNGISLSVVLSFTVTMPGAPTAPQSFTARPGNERVSLSWAAPASDGGSAITGYEVSGDNGVTWITPDTNTSHIFTGLTNGTSYTFQVRAVNAIGSGAAAAATAVSGARILDLSAATAEEIEIQSEDFVVRFSMISVYGEDPITIRGDGTAGGWAGGVGWAVHIAEATDIILDSSVRINTTDNTVALRINTAGAVISGGGAGVSIINSLPYGTQNGIYADGDLTIDAEISEVRVTGAAGIGIQAYNDITISASANIGTIFGTDTGLVASGSGQGVSIEGTVGNIIGGDGSGLYAGGGAIEISGTVGNITGDTGIMTTGTGSSVTITGTITGIITGTGAERHGITAFDITISGPVTARGERYAFSQQPIITLPSYTATWNTAPDGTSGTGGTSTSYTWDDAHKWVQILP